MFRQLRNTDALAQILLGALALQACVLCINGAPDRSSTLSLNALINALGNRHLEVGSSAPLLSVYDREGRKASLPEAGQVTLVFRGTCDCQDIAVWNWVQAAQRAGHSVALIAVVPPTQLANVDAPTPDFRHIYGCRRADFQQIAPRFSTNLPYVVHLRNGKVVALETS